MNLQSLFHWVYVAAMAIGALYFILLGTNPRGIHKHEYLIATFIPIWSGLAYTAMALDQGKVEVAGQITHYARYIDWIVTTPLLLLSLSSTAMYFMVKDWTLIASLMATQVVVIASGLVADLSTTDGTRFLWYICGVVAFLVVLWGVWVPLRAKARGQSVELSRHYDKLLIYFTVLWISYPITWLIGPSGLGLVNQTIETLLFCVLPFFSKVGFSYLDLNGLRRLNSVRTRAMATTPRI
ncbi:bacteriorhodopsin [Oscillatoria sp. FACHB-1407]|uniref:bacteriorhodopsin n=1 Tax=Oscillatoria sp. FACHB-1407 TaxID=2692847 RepID=UPI00168559C7|nr:bacteriorhodopsin [Oscillatoria sp. FACHB-1407]MBD2465487.1 bacteriorhodopsin [Oscillatoria sp. FACHB-1407]